MREFSRWCAEEIEKVCRRNDKPRPGKGLKPPWEKQSAIELYKKIDEEIFEVIDAYFNWTQNPTTDNKELLQWELADLATTAMMFSASLHPLMSLLRRGRNRRL